MELKGTLFSPWGHLARASSNLQVIKIHSNCQSCEWLEGRWRAEILRKPPDHWEYHQKEYYRRRCQIVTGG
jgi:hypothetical protein